VSPIHFESLSSQGLHPHECAMGRQSRPHLSHMVLQDAGATGVTERRMQVLQLPRFAPKLSCCLQDWPHPSRPAKPLPRNTLGPELRCCLQGGTAAVSGRGLSTADGCSPWLPDAPAGIVSRIGIAGAPLRGRSRHTSQYSGSEASSPTTRPGKMRAF
jgi:hypothetical protein